MSQVQIPKSLIYIDGEPHHKIDSKNVLEEMEYLIREKVASKELEKQKQQEEPDCFQHGAVIGFSKSNNKKINQCQKFNQSAV